ncbi:long-chain fatty acid transport protein 2 isoform X2 [Salminus brasiliensis]|uniref:long-chain fatty acid transport protein 2 isoform X2 n=1 Tax=Salminus brasiliensis TaxID=930266 RepID=UPI003B83698A
MWKGREREGKHTLQHSATSSLNLTRFLTRARVNMLAQCCALAGLGILALAVRVNFPYLWSDALYLKNFLVALVRFVSRRRLRPSFLAVDRFLEQAARHPTRTFFVFEGETFSYGAVDRRSNRIAHALLAHSSLRAGDTAALFLRNEPDFLYAWLALAKLGCPVALLNDNIRSGSLLHCFRCSRAKVLITSAELQGVVQEILAPLREDEVCVFVMAPECVSEHMQSLTEKMENVSDSPIPRSLRATVTLSDPGVYIYTSGTTGLPKAAKISQMRLLGSLAVLPSVGVTGDDVIYACLPLYHTAGFLISFISSVETGSTVILRKKFSVSQFWNDCRKHNVTVIQYIGEVIRYLCNTPKTEDDKKHKVRLAIGNGLRADVWQEFLSRFGKIDVKEFYASTESNVAFINYTGKIGAIGRVNFLYRLFPFALIKYDTEREEPVRDTKGRCIRVPTGETGLLVVKITKLAPFMGYAGNAEQTEKKRLRDVFQQGDVYFNSGDLLRMDHDHFLYFQDRVGDTFRWKGENVATTEVSDIITQVDFIKEGNVYGVQVPDNEGRVGMAAVTVKVGAEFDGTKLFNHVRKHLPNYAQPRFLRLQNAVELTGTFKQVKMKLVKEGFDPGEISDPLFFLSEAEQSYIPLTKTVYHSIVTGRVRL